MICKQEDNLVLMNLNISMNSLNMDLMMNSFGMLFTRLVDIMLILSLLKNSVNIFKKELLTEKYDRLNHFILHTNYTKKGIIWNHLNYKICQY